MVKTRRAAAAIASISNIDHSSNDVEMKLEKESKAMIDTLVDLGLIEELDIFIRGFPGLTEQYLPISKIGEGTFSTVYKAIDISHDRYINDGWMFANVPEQDSTSYMNALFDFVNNPDLYYRTSELPLECSFWRSKMESYFERTKHQSEKPQYVALKRINVTSSPDRILDEIQFIKSLHGCNEVVPIITALRYEDQIVVVMPYFHHQDFRDYLPKFNIQDIMYYMHSLLKAVAHIHDHNIIHRDLKPSNFLYSPSHRRGMLVDFGLAQRYQNENVKSGYKNIPVVNNTNQIQIVKKSSNGYYLNDPRPPIKASRAGTRGFRAPEVLFKFSGQSTAIDIWSVGVIFLTLLTGQYPFFNSPDDLESIVEIACIFGQKAMSQAAAIYGRIWNSNIETCPATQVSFKKLCQTFNPALTSTIPDDAYDLLGKCLHLNCYERITARDALKHPFFASIQDI